MKKIIFITAFLPLLGFCQESIDTVKVHEEIVDEPIYDMHELEQKAQFPGGKQELLKFIIYL